MNSDMILEDVLEEHVEEAAILWDNRRDAVQSPDYDLEDLCDLDDRIEAHLDGLRIAATAGWDAATQQDPETAGDLFVLTSLALAQQDPATLHQLIDDFHDQAPLNDGIAGALAWAPADTLRSVVSSLLQSTAPHKMATGLRACIVHKANPGQSLLKCFALKNPTIDSLVMELIATLKHPELLRQSASSIDGSNHQALLHANRAAASMGDKNATQQLLKFVSSGHPMSRGAAATLMPLLDIATQQSLVRQLAANESTRLLALYCAGLSGQGCWLNDLIKHLPHEAYQQECNDAILLITGVNMLAQLEPIDADDDVDEDPDQGPVWDGGAVEQLAQHWWQLHQRHYQADLRYLNGAIITNDSLLATLQSGSQRHRYRAAEEIAASPGGTWFDVTAPGLTQLHRLADRS